MNLTESRHRKLGGKEHQLTGQILTYAVHGLLNLIGHKDANVQNFVGFGFKQEPFEINGNGN